MKWALIDNYLNLGVFNVKTSVIKILHLNLLHIIRLTMAYYQNLGGFKVKPSVNYLHSAFTTHNTPTYGVLVINISEVLMLNHL